MGHFALARLSGLQKHCSVRDMLLRFRFLRTAGLQGSWLLGSLYVSDATLIRGDVTRISRTWAERSLARPGNRRG